eukprot:CFRG6064T1
MQIAFVYGFLFGQAVLCCLLGFVFYYFCLRPQRNEGVHISKAAYAQELPTMKSVTDVPLESGRWLSGLLQSLYVTFRHRGLQAFILDRIKHVLTGDNMPDFLGAVTITDFTLPDDMPVIEEASIVKSNESDMDLLVKVHWSGTINISVELQILVNYPMPRFAVLPVTLSLSLERFDGLTRLRMPGHVDKSILFSFEGDPILDFSLGSVIGAATRVHDPPKLIEIVVSRLRNIIHEQLVSPQCVSIDIPHDIFTSAAPTTHVSSRSPITQSLSTPSAKNLSKAHQAAANKLESSKYGIESHNPGGELKGFSTSPNEVQKHNQVGLTQVLQGIPSSPLIQRRTATVSSPKIRKTRRNTKGTKYP